MIVDAAANIEVTRGAIACGKFLNAGQTCIAPDYVLVARDRPRSSSADRPRHP